MIPVRSQPTEVKSMVMLVVRVMSRVSVSYVNLEKQGKRFMFDFLTRNAINLG